MKVVSLLSLLQINMIDKVKIVYEDEYLLGVSKPHGLFVIPGRFDKDEPFLRRILEEKFGRRLWVIHRIDRGTSGLVIFGKTSEAHREMCILFEHRKVKKRYIGIVMGDVEYDGTIDKPIRQGRKGKYKVAENGKPAVTKYRVMERFKGFTLLSILPLTGRPHQIRVHLKYIGYPIAVDPVYNKSLPEEYKEIFEPIIKAHPKALSLHSFSLKFVHPFTKKETEIKAGLSEEMKAVIERLRLKTKIQS